MFNMLFIIVKSCFYSSKLSELGVYNSDKDDDKCLVTFLC